MADAAGQGRDVRSGGNAAGGACGDGDVLTRAILWTDVARPFGRLQRLRKTGPFSWSPIRCRRLSKPSRPGRSRLRSGQRRNSRQSESLPVGAKNSTDGEVGGGEPPLFLDAGKVEETSGFCAMVSLSDTELSAVDEIPRRRQPRCETEGRTDAS